MATDEFISHIRKKKVEKEYIESVNLRLIREPDNNDDLLKKSTISKSFKPIAGETKNSLVDEQDARPNLQRNCRSIKFVTKSD